MVNPLQQQLLKAGLVTKKQVQQANQDKKKKQKHQRSTNEKTVDETRLKVQQAASEKAQRDRELNLKKQQQARQKAISMEIDQLVRDHRLPRESCCDIVYNFEHKGKIKRIYINSEMKEQIIKGQLGIARIEGGYELVPRNIADKIQQRNEKRIVLFSSDQQAQDKAADENDPYAAYEIPDDLMW